MGHASGYAEWVTDRGLYFLTGTAQNPSRGWNATLFTFTVQPADFGEVLDWLFDGRDTGTSLSTRILDAFNRTVDVTDNYVSFWPTAVIGRLALDHLDPAAPFPRRLPFRIDTGAEIQDAEAFVDPDGIYTLHVPRGELTLSCKLSHWLRHTFEVDTTNTDIVQRDIFLYNGDAFMDNRVDFRDVAKVLVYFGSDNPNADMDEDGLVDLADLVGVLFNYGLVGDE